MLSLLFLLNMTLGWTSSRSKTTEINAAPNDLFIVLSLFATNLESPVGITNAGPGDDRLFVIERAGRIKIILPDGTVLPTPYLNITDKVESSSGEQGLLGLTFHPDYANNGYFYINYTHTSQPGMTLTRISRFQVSGDTDVANPDSEDVLLTVDQPEINHNAGGINFGPDGFLYVPLGDGGGGGDQDDIAQDPATLLGKIVRIDVDSGDGGRSKDCQGVGTGHYTVPGTNPFVDESGYCDEIWALGLRNPWQSSFDSLTGDLYIGDVGQGDWEEVDFQPVASAGGENYGWRCYEGNHPFNLSNCDPREDYKFPIFEYQNLPGPNTPASVVGGYVYRGSQSPALYGHYFLTDAYSGIFWDLAPSDADWFATEHTYLNIRNLVAFGEDSNGEIYIANIANGNIYHLSGYDKNGFDERAFLPFVSK